MKKVDKKPPARGVLVALLSLAWYTGAGWLLTAGAWRGMPARSSQR